MRIGQRSFIGAGLLMALALPALADDPRPADTKPDAAAATSQPASSAAPASAASADAEFAAALDKRLFVAGGNATEPEKSERDALAVFYQSRQGAPLWVDAKGLNPKGSATAEEIKKAGDYGLDAKDFAVPALISARDASAPLSADARAEAEAMISLSVMKYARHARGGRIMDPAESLNSNLDRKPQLLEPKAVIEGIATAEAPDAYLRGLHPKHPQFEALRQAFLVARAGDAKQKGAAADAGSLSAYAKKLRANMEEWRWMPGDMGEMHVLNNIPEFMQYVYKDGQVIRSEKIVAGLVDKQSSIFSRPLKHVVLRPAWRVPESIKVNELWPSLLRGGGLMREYGLQLETKDGKPLDYHSIDWTKNDIRNYEVTQPPGAKSVLGVVKFSFPSQHTIYMHDTPDRWMFKPAQRTLSHGCLRVWKPVELAEIILKEDKGWDKDKVAELIRSGPLNNEVAIDKRIPIHLTYFTAWADANGKVRTFTDIYGHEKRITLALDGKWSEINKGRDHLAPVEPNFNPKRVAEPRVAAQQRRARESSVTDVLGNAFGIGF
jgi:murein L,D-transpeptidase YcbB/YkuD